MSGLRERKKRETEERIVNSAREVFLTRGYENTTVSEIARAAAIGTGTFYNYFSSKAQVFLYVFFAQPEELEDKVFPILNNPGDDVVKAVISVCRVYEDSMRDVNKDLWKEIMKVFFSDMEEHKRAMSEFIKLDFQFIEHVQRLLAGFRDTGLLADTCDPQDAAQCIYGIFMVQMMMFLLEEEQPFETMMENCVRQIKLFFSRKLAGE